MKFGRKSTEKAMSEVLKPVVVKPLEKLVTQSVVKTIPEIKKEEQETFDDSEQFEAGYDTAFGDSTLQPHSEVEKTPRRKIPLLKTSTPTDRIPQVKLESPVATQKLVQTYLARFSTEREVDLDTEFGVRKLQIGMKIGYFNVTFNGNLMTLRNENYIRTPGLIELIFKRSPNMSLVTESDKDTYGHIILTTNAHRLYYQENKSLRTSNSLNYQTIIKNLLLSKKTGTALPHHMIASIIPRKMDYVYWDHPNELVDRLRLLMAYQEADNTSHTNEILSIMEKLREAGII
ncbi:uncharacterized protein LOC107044239 [Diachasma alloeum]|uniref:uncharacterized protein LOC107044239 n=1 Tax=Diachasma alloeum TaxID=454923 RepID=UPI0007384555|nr:uncharacterized protein LOC107044239 [Diachasma alloeum]